MPIFQGWDAVIRIVASAILIYLTIIVIIRLLGKRSTSKLNNYDWIITVALGSMTGSVIVSQSVVIVDGIIAISLVLLLQYITTKFAARLSFVRSAVHAPATLLFIEGRFLEQNMKKERILKQEVLSAIRRSGFGSLRTVRAVILESDAELSVLGGDVELDSALLEDVEGYPA